MHDKDRMFPAVINLTIVERRAARHPDDELEDVYRRHAESVTRRLARIFGYADADEAVSDALLRLYDELTAGQRFKNASGWLFRVAGRLLIDRVKRRQRERSRLEPWPRVRPAASPEQALVDRTAIAPVLRALQAVPDLERECFLLRRVDGLRLREIADRLEIERGIRLDVRRISEAVQRASRIIEERLT